MVKAKYIYILPEATLAYTEHQIEKFVEFWNQGITIGDIAEHFGLAIYEVALLVIHCDLEGMINPRDGGLLGTLPRKKRSG